MGGELGLEGVEEEAIDAAALRGERLNDGEDAFDEATAAGALSAEAGFAQDDGMAEVELGAIMPRPGLCRVVSRDVANAEGPLAFGELGVGIIRGPEGMRARHPMAGIAMA